MIFHQGEDQRTDVPSSPPSNTTVLLETSSYQKYTECPFNKLYTDLEYMISTNTHTHMHIHRILQILKITPLRLFKNTKSNFYFEQVEITKEMLFDHKFLISLRLAGNLHGL